MAIDRPGPTRPEFKVQWELCFKNLIIGSIGRLRGIHNNKRWKILSMGLTQNIFLKY